MPATAQAVRRAVAQAQSREILMPPPPQAAPDLDEQVQRGLLDDALCHTVEPLPRPLSYIILAPYGVDRHPAQTEEMLCPQQLLPEPQQRLRGHGPPLRTGNDLLRIPTSQKPIARPLNPPLAPYSTPPGTPLRATSTSVPVNRCASPGDVVPQMKPWRACRDDRARTGIRPEREEGTRRKALAFMPNHELAAHGRFLPAS